MAKELLHKYFTEGISLSEYSPGDKQLPYKITEEYKGEQFSGINYHQLLNYKPTDGDAFRVILTDFVTTEDGTGIVHMLLFGADDNLFANKNGIGSLTLVDEQGRFTKEMDELSGQYVKEEFYTESEEKAKIS